MSTGTVRDIEADLVELRAAAERAGAALGCLFSSSDEFEAAVIEASRRQGALRSPRRAGGPWWSALRLMVLTFAFLMM